MRDLIFRNEFDDFKSRLDGIRKELEATSFNIFSISSTTSHKENFHSDIIALLLDPSEKHGAKSIYLHLFLDFLIDKYSVDIDKNNYADVIIVKESYTDSLSLKGRIDILIRDIRSKHCIIIENKINNAVDTDRQLEKYYVNETTHGFKVDAIVYLSLDANKRAPLTDNYSINKLMINIAAFSNTPSDLYAGWILPCYRASINDSANSFIFEYLKLLKHLSQMGLDRNLKDEFYDIISQKDGLERVRSIMELYSSLNEYRADIFMEKMGNDITPFTKTYRWRPNYWLFENYIEEGIKYKLDIQFSDKFIRVDLWNPDQISDKNIIINKLETLGYLNDFSDGGFGNGMYKMFEVKEGLSINDLDSQFVDYIKCFMTKLKSK